MAKGPSRIARAARDLKKVKKDLQGKNGKSRSRAYTRGNATVVLAQGALAAPKRAFGGGRNPKGRNVASLLKCLDARIPRTLGLPRAVGPYSVIRTTALHSSSSRFLMFCPIYNESSTSWYNACGIEGVTSGSPVNSGQHTSVAHAFPLMSQAEVVPSGLTVQVMNPASLQTADGLFAMARVNQQLALGGTTATYDEMAARCISFYAPRMLTGGKLALRGVKCSSYPLDMSEYSHFAPMLHFGGEAFAWSTNALRPAALAPIVFVQENAQPKTMQFLVTMEWRVRFDPANPATASLQQRRTWR